MPSQIRHLVSTWFLLLVAIVTVAGTSAQEVDVPVAVGQVSEPVRGQYIVIFNDRVTNPRAEAARLVRGSGGELLHTYQYALKGFAARIPDHAFQGISRNPNVDFVVEDITVHAFPVQNNPVWGLDRVDQRGLPLDNRYIYNNEGVGVYAYILDTGIRSSHTEFGGRVAPGWTAINDGRGTQDCSGHGTHVAGTVGGRIYGIAKSVTLVPVRVLDCSGFGTASGVIAGVDWVAGQRLAHSSRPMVANMSIGGSASSPVDSAVQNAVTRGVVFVVAAGNDSANACNYSPAREPSALTVGATANNDARASFSNFGNCLDLFAPGQGIISAYHSSDTAVASASGTSMAAPHVAGVAALVLGSNPSATVSQIHQAIIGGATTNAVTGAGTGSPNRLLYSLVHGGPSAPLRLLTVSKSGSGLGTVTSAPPGIDCGSACNAHFASGTQVGLTAAPLSGSIFSGWSGACSGTGTCNIEMTQAYNVTATFDWPGAILLGHALDNTNLGWNTGGSAISAIWSPSTDNFIFGDSAATSGVIGHSQRSWIQTTITGPGTLSFWWRVSSERNYDFLSFYANDMLQQGRISGEVDWTQQIWIFPEGKWTVRWEYEKDNIISSGADRGWLDRVEWSPTGPCPYSEFYDLVGTTLTETQTFGACQKLAAGPQLTIEGLSTNVTLQAGQRIVLKHGVRVRKGAELRARIVSSFQ